jgi:NET1-associated nuclear protein 1 (U3 small nucleolar RNA-associated protein 17)
MIHIHLCSFSLNTSIDWPHEHGIQSLKIQPISDTDPTILAATSGLDGLFKTWGKVEDPSIHGRSEWWNCENAGTYRGLPSGPLSFSSDGSLLAVAFKQILTIWDADNHALKLSLCHSKLKEDIT